MAEDAARMDAPATEVVQHEKASAAGEDEETAAVSALQHSIQQLGKHSYYYAHASTNADPSLQWDGNQEPRLLMRTAAGDAPIARHKIPVTSYAWADEKTTVKIYVPLEGAADIADDETSLSWTAQSVTLDVLAGGEDQRLHVPALCEEISGAVLKKRSDKLVIILKKKDEISWPNLKKNAL